MIRKYPVTVVGGAGTWGRCYVHAYARHPDCEVGLVDRAGDRRQMFADRYGKTQVYDRLEDLLAEDLPDIVSAVIPVESNPETGSDDFFTIRIERLLPARDSSEDELDSGCGYHQALETAIVLKQSARSDYAGIYPPLKDR